MPSQPPTSAIPLLAHRGYAARYPENTREAISAAVAAGATLVEFDIQLTRDGVPVLLHDADFRRTGNSKASVFDIDYAQVRQLDVSEPEKFGPAFSGTTVPALADIVADLIDWPQVTAFVEIKRHSIDHFGVEAVLDAVLPVLEPVLNQSVLISFNADVLYATRQRVSMPIGWALRDYGSKSRLIANDLLPDYLFCNQTRLPPQSDALWQGPWQWVVYEVTKPKVARKLVERGVAIIETKAYAEMAMALGDERGGR